MSKLVHEAEDGPVNQGYLGSDWLLVYKDRTLPKEQLNEVMDQDQFLELSQFEKE